MCKFMLKEVQQKGGRYHGSCSPQALLKDAQGNLTGIQLNNGETISCTKLVFTSGSWTPRIFDKLFPTSKKAQRRIHDIGKLAGHAIIVKSPHWQSIVQDGRLPQGCHAVFATTFSASSAIAGSKSFAPVSSGAFLSYAFSHSDSPNRRSSRAYQTKSTLLALILRLPLFPNELTRVSSMITMLTL